MTDTDLILLVERRRAAHDAMGRLHQLLGRMDPETRARADAASRTFRDCDGAITEELIRRDRPVPLGDTVLHLTADRLNFVALPRGKPLHGKVAWKLCVPSRATLYDYPGSPGRNPDDRVNP